LFLDERLYEFPRRSRKGCFSTSATSVTGPAVAGSAVVKPAAIISRRVAWKLNWEPVDGTRSVLLHVAFCTAATDEAKTGER
jgi:hypothetical protein